MWELGVRLGSLDVPAAGWVAPEGLGGDPYVCCGDLGLAWLGLTDAGEVELRPLADPERELPENRYNDGCFGPEGRYWAGTMHDPEERATGTLYAFGPDGSAAVLDRGYRVPNGPAFAPDAPLAYHADSALGMLYAFDLDAGGDPVGRRELARFETGEGSPDGMATDREGTLWVAMWDGARVERIRPDGERLEPVRMPVRRPTSCAFAAGALWVTSAADDESPLAGGLFRVSL